MAKKAKHEEHVNHEAWAIPYGDLVTLLLAFFVVMYSISSVNEGKYRVLSDSMSATFNGAPKAIQPIQVGSKPTSNPQVSAIDSVSPALSMQSTPRISLSGMPGRAETVARGAAQVRGRGDDKAGDRGLAARELANLATEIEHAMAPLIDAQLIMVRRNEQWLEVEIKTDILFPSAVAAISPGAQEVLDELAQIFARFPNAIRVEGYTDDRPINTPVFPSNWELSAARAASVVRRFAEHGVAPPRLGIVGWGEQRPADDNRTEAGRNRNRRVLIVVLSTDTAPERPRSELPQIGDAADNAIAPATASVAPATQQEATP